MQTLARFLSSWAYWLRLQGIDSPRLSAEVITARVLGLSRLELVLSHERPLAPNETEQAEASLRRRGQGEPLAYILGQKEFYGQDFRVSDQVLIPRPETEQVIETVRELFPREKPFFFADVCTGSGVIGIMLAKLFPGSRGLLLDVSPAALEVARRNILDHGLQRRLCPVRADLAAGIGPGSLDLLVANPPYIPEGELATLSPEIQKYEPRLALNGGPSGLDAIKALFNQGHKPLKEGAWLVMEVGCGQCASILKRPRAVDDLWTTLRTFKDLSGRERVVALQKAVC